ncbi:MAG TPA: NAD(+)/NADH kinase, partial [Polyangiaceae bacterium]|nr:NAD(+)/NADH kinase [Polyangiaceae bacterium]
MTFAPHVCVVVKRSSWRKWVEEENDARVAALLEAGDETVRRMHPGHREHTETIDEVRRALADLRIEASWYDRAPGFRVEGRCDLVVTVGGDGTLLAASHGIGPGIPLLGVNSAPNHSVGFFCAARKGAVREALAAALDGALRRTELTRMRVETGGRVLHDRVLNEALFCHASPAATSRYILRLIDAMSEGRVLAEEEQKSSGLWIGPAAGSTAAQRSAGGRVMPLSSRKLQYVVREPYRPGVDALRMTLGVVDEGEVLAIRSQMRQGRVFLDGDRIMHEVGIGDVVTMRRSDEPLVVLGLSRDAAKGGAFRRSLRDPGVGGRR